MAKEVAANGKNVLFLTNSEYGQANVQFALAHEFLTEGFHVHFGSFSALKPRFYDFFKSRALCYPVSALKTKITFHTLPGPSMDETKLRRSGTDDMSHPPGIRGALASYANMPLYTADWSPSEYVAGVEACELIVQAAKPFVTIIDTLLRQAQDAARKINHPSVILDPITWRYTLAGMQPKAAALWKYPAVSSAFPYPVPWHLIPLNIYLTIRLIISSIRSPGYLALNHARAANNIDGPFPMMEPYLPHHLYLCPSLPETDFPVLNNTDNVIGCGPIVLPTTKLDERLLLTWLEDRPTVLINLGTHFASGEETIRELSFGLKSFLDDHPSTQVLWKLKRQVNNTTEPMECYKILSRYLDNDRVRIVNWLDSDPLAILQTGHIVCSVHHGGANSYNEALYTGTPQLVLGSWLDTYECAARVDYIGVGVYGNRMTAPKAERAEFATALAQVVDDSSKRHKAREIQQTCSRRGEGRKIAYQAVMKWKENH